MKKAVAIIAGILLLTLLILFSTTYTVRFNEVAVKTTFGKTDEGSISDEPGVHFRWPLFADRVTKYDTRIQLADTSLSEIPTADGQSVVIRAFLMWKVDPDSFLTFYRSFPTTDDLERVLNETLNTAVKGAVGQYAFDELIGADSRLPDAEQKIKSQLASLATVGIEPVTVGISQMVLPPKTTTAVLNRMQATRKKLAETERFKGNSDAVAIRGEAKTVAEKLRAFADQRSEEIKAVANQRAAQYLQQMSEDEQLAIFLVWLDTMVAGLKDTTTLILTDEQAPYHLLNLNKLGDGDMIPMPEKGHMAGDKPEEPEIVSDRSSS